ncbi:ATP-binding protein [Streptomyces albireticuli]|uniref:ATP-binding protein n=1 Tax=Streptomyces albireticuli TaxID=1940 RepID=A0A2A2DAJ0_9ACTN|nr:ATP-binding protein [Streptomyces albireticuli]MCD9141470.1 ATP-binding protein [Streptomyces albireticuli]MCD9164279.1 ATP-binding protein [Streptomyces albireticuli]MCD9196402.1 ATP-binding protein [Streptomyces albireticuli]PAU49488.1 ATP-binding protein [Streptomyces albireticuli]
MPSDTDLAKVARCLRAEAFQRPAEHVWVRSARHDVEGCRIGQTIVIDLGRADGRQIVAEPGWWEVREGDHPTGAVFRRSRALKAMVVPDRAVKDEDEDDAENGLEVLRSLLNLSASDFRLYVAWLLFSWVPDRAHPILAILGQQGTAKTKMANYGAGLVSPAVTAGPPRNADDWIAGASAGWISIIDNLSNISAQMADVLCRAVTGDALIKRSLHSDNDAFMITLRRPVIITSIDAGALRGDLAERILPLHPQPLGDRRRSEEELDATYEQAKPRMVQALLDLFVQVLEKLPETHPHPLPRMADFARWLDALDQVAGWSTLDDYRATFQAMSEEVIVSDPFLEAVLNLARSNPDGLRMIAARVLESVVTPERPPRGWPASGREARGALERGAPALLQRHGLRLIFPADKEHRRKDGYQIVFSWARSAEPD